MADLIRRNNSGIHSPPPEAVILPPPAAGGPSGSGVVPGRLAAAGGTLPAGTYGGLSTNPLTGLDDASNHFPPTQGEDVSELISKYGKVFHDKVHDQMRLPGALVAVIDTPEYQRLRNLHQLGSTQHLFPGATHTRFEHSLGVAHLGMKMVKCLKSMHESFPPNLDITDADVLCIGLAGLCHDLGHGPLSHMFEEFVNEARHRRARPGERVVEWHHEEASEMLFDHLIEANGLDMTQYGLENHDLRFVKKLIRGLSPSAPWPEDIGRPPEKRYLFDIIANKRNGIDVDKLDYFLRDSLSCFGRLPDVLIERIFSCTRVIQCDDQYQICYEEKVALTLGDLFYLRAKLHKFVYQHRVTKVVDDMTVQALLAADEHFFIETAGGGKCRLSDCVNDARAYAKTGDWILGAIAATESPQLAAARAIIHNISTRKLYRMVGFCDAEYASRIVPGIMQRIDPAERAYISEDSICVLKSKIIYGSSGEEGGNPLRNVRFFNPKRSFDYARKLSDTRVSKLFSPRDYSEQVCLVFSRTHDHVPAILAAYERWKNEILVREPMPFANACSPIRAQSRKRERAGSPSTAPQQSIGAMSSGNGAAAVTIQSSIAAAGGSTEQFAGTD